MDALTVPQALVMIDQMREYPPTNILLAEFIKGLGAPRETGPTDAQLSKLPNVVKSSPAEGVRTYFSRTGNKIKSLINKRTGQRIV